jgi:hypothetical protein
MYKYVSFWQNFQERVERPHLKIHFQVRVMEWPTPENTTCMCGWWGDLHLQIDWKKTKKWAPLATPSPCLGASCRAPHPLPRSPAVTSPASELRPRAGCRVPCIGGCAHHVLEAKCPALLETKAGTSTVMFPMLELRPCMLMVMATTRTPLDTHTKFRVRHTLFCFYGIVDMLSKSMLEASSRGPHQASFVETNMLSVSTKENNASLTHAFPHWYNIRDTLLSGVVM